MHKLTKGYLQKDESVAHLYQWPLNFEGSVRAIEARKRFPVNRKILVNSLQRQYNSIQNNFPQTAENKQVTDNISALLQENTFTVTTGHQLNIFT
ncbi:MAG: bacillithiol biosynthesis protein BshC, partial [Bacteroidia bacterium]